VDLQTLILDLQRYWADCGCIIQQPYDVEVGAGTMHPESFLRVLGPEPTELHTSSRRAGRRTPATAKIPSDWGATSSCR